MHFLLWRYTSFNILLYCIVNAENYRLGVKAITCKAKAKDLTFKAKAKDLASEAKAKDLTF